MHVAIYWAAESGHSGVLVQKIVVLAEKDSRSVGYSGGFDSLVVAYLIHHQAIPTKT